MRRDCVLSLGDGAPVTLVVTHGEDGALMGSVDPTLLIDPFGLVFGCTDGTPVSPARDTIVDAVTGEPAKVYGDNGRAR